MLLPWFTKLRFAFALALPNVSVVFWDFSVAGVDPPGFLQLSSSGAVGAVGVNSDSTPGLALGREFKNQFPQKSVVGWGSKFDPDCLVLEPDGSKIRQGCAPECRLFWFVASVLLGIWLFPSILVLVVLPFPCCCQLTRKVWFNALPDFFPCETVGQNDSKLSSRTYNICRQEPELPDSPARQSWLLAMIHNFRYLGSACGKEPPRSRSDLFMWCCCAGKSAGSTHSKSFLNELMSRSTSMKVFSPKKIWCMGSRLVCWLDTGLVLRWFNSWVCCSPVGKGWRYYSPWGMTYNALESLNPCVPNTWQQWLSELSVAAASGSELSKLPFLLWGYATRESWGMMSTASWSKYHEQ